MPNFLLIYKAETSQVPQDEAEAAEAMAAWGAWMERLGTQLVDPGNPVGQSWTVTSDGARDGGNTPPIMGYSIVEAETIEAACALAADNPMVTGGGEVEVSPIMQVGG